jgi:hypothetical protein
MKKIILLSALVASIVSVKASDEPFFQASLTPDIAIHSKTTEISGICLSIWGENPQSAFAFGFVNGSTGDSGGFTWGLVNYDDSYTGVAWAIVNVSKEKFVGWQSGAINVAKEFHGLQLGFVNYSENLRGVQLGFVNVAMNNPWFNEFPDKLATGFPIVNWSF